MSQNWLAWGENLHHIGDSKVSEGSVLRKSQRPQDRETQWEELGFLSAVHVYRSHTTPEKRSDCTHAEHSPWNKKTVARLTLENTNEWKPLADGTSTDAK